MQFVGFISDTMIVLKTIESVKKLKKLGVEHGKFDFM